MTSRYEILQELPDRFKGALALRVSAAVDVAAEVERQMEHVMRLAGTMRCDPYLVFPDGSMEVLGPVAIANHAQEWDMILVLFDPH